MYDGPIMKIKNKPFSKNMKARGGFIKASYFKCIDGDTVSFRINGKLERVRLLVIDTPELSPVPKPYAIEAKEYLIKILENANSIYLQSDRNSDLRDKTESKRLLAWLWVDNKLVNYILVKDGYASVKYIQNERIKYLKKLDFAQNYAKEHKLRIHGE